MGEASREWTLATLRDAPNADVLRRAAEIVEAVEADNLLTENNRIVHKGSVVSALRRLASENEGDTDGGQ